VIAERRRSASDVVATLVGAAGARFLSLPGASAKIRVAANRPR